MTTLVAQTLFNELIQEVRYNLQERKHIGCISPYLYLHNAVGTFTFEVIKDSVTIFSKSFTPDDVKASLGTTFDYMHVFYPIIPGEPLKLEKGLYSFRLSATGYTANSVSFIAWLQQFEDIQNEMDYIPLTSDQNSLAFRIKEYKEGVL